MTEMICIGCPMGCGLVVTDTDGVWSVTGNQCKIGDSYAREEMQNPRRNITTSIPVTGGTIKMLSVKTQKPVPKQAIMDCVAAVKQITAVAPVQIGDVMLADVAGTGVDVVATRAIKAAGSA